MSHMTASSPTPAERARKAHVTILRALQEPGRQVALATAMGVSESTVSRFKSDHLEQLCAVISHLGLKVVPTEFQCVDQKTFAAFQILWERAMSQTSAAKLIFEDSE